MHILKTRRNLGLNAAMTGTVVASMLGFLVTAGPALAGTGIGTTVTMPSPVAVGSTGNAASIQFVNTSTAPDDVNTVTISGIQIKTTASNTGVFALSGSGTQDAGTSCGAVNFTVTPAGAGTWNVTPNSTLQQVGITGTCRINFTFDVLTFPAADDNPVAGAPGTQAFLGVTGTASNTFTGTPGNAAGTGQTTVNPATAPVVTAIHNAAHAVILATEIGKTAHDSVTVSAVGVGPTPTGTATFKWFTNNSCEGTAADTSAPIPLVGGVADATSFPQTPATAGAYAFRATYNGDTNYNSNTSACEPLKAVDANITIGVDGTNPVNDPHTFTVTVMKNPGTGLVAAAGEHVDFTLTNGGGAVAVLDAVNSTCDNAGPNTDVNGQCIIVFTSATPGTTVGNASVTLSVEGVSLARDTDPATASIGAGPGGSGPTTKTWTSFTAQMSTTIHNGADHVTAVTAVPAGSTVHDSATVSGTNGGDPVPTGNVAFTFWTGGNNCDTGQSAPAGTVPLVAGVAHPSDPEAALGVGLYAFKASYAGGQDPNYPNGATSLCEPLSVVDARITISPTGTNEVGHAHTFTVLVEKNDGTATGWVPASGVTINSTELGIGSITGGTCGPTGPTDVLGQCTVIVNSASAGSSTVQASGTVSVGGVNVIVATDGHGAHDIHNQKTWVDANITIGPDGTNNVNVNHTFTVTVKKDPGTGLVAAAGEHVDFTLTDSGGAAAVVNAALSTCDDAGPNTNASGQCTIVFTSATAGQTVGNATVTLLVGGVSLTRDTNPATATIGSGPGGSGPATKTWEQPGGQYCSPGYWKQSQHFHSWVTYTQSQPFLSVFGRTITIMWSAGGKPAPLTNPTLLQALQANGGGTSQLARVAVDALLNSTSMNSGFTPAQVISIVQQAIDTNNMSLLNQFTIPENCPLN